jgi:hypothetical protein
MEFRQRPSGRSRNCSSRYHLALSWMWGNPDLIVEESLRGVTISPIRCGFDKSRRLLSFGGAAHSQMARKNPQQRYGDRWNPLDHIEDLAQLR